MKKSLGQVAYEAYYKAIGGWATDRHWDMISPDERSAWVAVGQDVVQATVVLSPNSSATTASESAS